MESASVDPGKRLHIFTSYSRPLRFTDTSTSFSNILELLFYGYLLYTYLAIPYGIFVPLLAGAWLLSLGILAIVVRFQENRGQNFQFIFLIFATSTSFILIQHLIYQIPLDNQYFKTLFFWSVTALIFDDLSTKPGFIKRLAVVMFLITLFLWPKLDMWEGSIGVLRARADGSGGIENPNDFAAFAGLTVLIFGLWGIGQAYFWRKFLLWGAALVGLYLSLSTVSRGTLLALVIAGIVGVRKLNIWHRLALIVFVLLGSYLVIELGFFSTIFEYYTSRGTEETGRMILWPLAIETIMSYPLLGVGLDNVLLYQGKVPHNSFFFLWVSSGIIPIIPYVLLWFTALKKAIRWDNPFAFQIIDPLPLMVFAFIQINVADLSFVAISCLAPLFYSRTRELLEKSEILLF